MCLAGTRHIGRYEQVRLSAIRARRLWRSKGIIVRAIVRYLLLLALLCVSSACTSESVPDAGSAGGSMGDAAGVPETEDQKILNALERIS